MVQDATQNSFSASDCTEKNIFTPRSSEEKKEELKKLQDYNIVMKKIISFFFKRNFSLANGQEVLSLLAACEDPKTVTTFFYQGKIYSHIQTSQMTMEAYFLSHPELKKMFNITTSYRQEPNPIPGRHLCVFSLLEFEFEGNFEDLLRLKSDLFKYLGFKPPVGMDDFPRVKYLDMCKKYGVKELGHEHEEQLYRDYGDIVFLTHFPKEFSYWNMKLDDDKIVTLKTDTIAGGQEAVGAAERAINTKEMVTQFYSIENGEYAKMLHSKFPKKRVQKELSDYLNLPFRTRAGAGIGVYRVTQAMKRANLL